MTPTTRGVVGRAAVAAVAVAVLAALATGDLGLRGWEPGGQLVAQPAAGEVALAGRPSLLVCPPAPRLGAEVEGDEADEDFRATSSSRSQTVLRTADGVAAAVATLPAEERPPSAVPVEAAGDGSRASTDGADPVAVRAAAAVPVGALAVSVADDGDLAGLAASSCGYPAETGWLVGGGVEPGRSGRVVLSNPGATTSTVDLVVLTPQGPVSPPAAQDLAIPGGSTREVLLESLLDPVPVVAVGVSARGGAVAAHLVDTRLDGVRAQGVEQVPLVQPGTSLTLPGVLPGPYTHAALRIANPGTAPAAVGWQLLGPDGAVAQAGETVLTVPAGSVAEVPLEEVRRAASRSPEALAVQVTSDQPVAAAVQTRVDRAGGLADHAVAVPADPLDGSAVVPLPGDDRVGAVIALAATDRVAAVEVVPLDAEGADAGEPQEVQVEPGRTAVVVPPAQAAQVRLQVRAGAVAAATVLWSQPDDRPRISLVSTVPLLVPPAAPGSVLVDQLPPDVLRAPRSPAP